MADEAAFAAQRVFEPYLRDRGFVNGRWVEAQDGRRFEVTDPSSGRAIVSVPRMGAAETRAAIAAAEAALPGWRGGTAGERAEVIRRWFDLMMARQDDLARAAHHRAGQAAGRGAGARSPTRASFIEWFAEEAKRVYGDTIPQPRGRQAASSSSSSRSASCAAITPWNFPAAMITRKAGAGAGRRLHGGAQAGRRRRRSRRWRWPSWPSAPASRRASSTWSPATASAIGGELTSQPDRAQAHLHRLDRGRQAADGAVRRPRSRSSSLELGGNAPFIVFDDADLDAAVEGAIASKYRNTGQTCVCANRIYVQDGVYDAFAEKLAGDGREAEGRQRHWSRASAAAR